MAKVAAVVASTGTQGFSVVKALASNGFHVRALTRSPANATSTFASLPNVEPLYFDIEARDSVEAAFEGADVVFGVTLPDQAVAMGAPGTPPSVKLDELEQAKIMADVAKAKGVRVFFFSSIPGPYGYTKYAGKVMTREHKWNAARYMQSIDLPAVFLGLGFFNENLDKFKRVVLQDDTLVYKLAHPNLHDKLYAHVSVDADLGRAVMTLLDNYETLGLKHRRVNIVERLYSNDEVLDVLSRTSGLKAVLEPLPSYGAKDSPYDFMFKSMGDPETPYVPQSELPDPTLAKLGFEWTPLEQYVRETLLPALGVKPQV